MVKNEKQYEDVIGTVAHHLTGGIASTCCYRGGWDGSNPQCECRDLAERILETWPDFADVVRKSPEHSGDAE